MDADNPPLDGATVLESEWGIVMKSFCMVFSLSLGSLTLICQETVSPALKISLKPPPVSVTNAPPQPRMTLSTPRATPAQLDEPNEETISDPKLPIEYGGVFTELFGPPALSEATRVHAIQRSTLWQMINPLAPLSERERRAVPRDWRGRRLAPARFRRLVDSEPQGINLFFIRF